jgi:ferredoxin
MTYPMMQHIPLRSAYLCQDCNSIGNCAEQCPACASAVLMNLASVLDRDAAKEERRVTHHGKYPAVVEIRAMVA